MSSSLTQWLLDHYGREEVKKETGLSRIRLALTSIVPELSQKKIVTIAGTNGKGETTLWLSRYLERRSHCTWISPHIERITERFQSEDGEISESLLEELVLECHDLVEKNKYQLTYYEFLFFVFCHWARKRSPDFLLLEVGLGGRLDAVNIFDADLVLLPSISRDHQEFLGNRYDLILREKLGLLRPKTQLISFLSLHYLREKTHDIVSSVGAKNIDLEVWKLAEKWEFSIRNQILARAAYLVLTGVEEQNLREELKTFRPGAHFLEYRGETISSRGEWIFYGSHNVDGVRNLIQFLQCGNYNFGGPPYDAILVAFSKRGPGDLRTMLKMLKQSGLGKIFVTSFPHPKAMDSGVMEKLADLEGIKFVHDVEAFIQNSKSSTTLVTGSYYFMGHLRNIIRSC
jgi:dihydrofolate synthase/folylpolyglutamate synthase